MLILLSNPGVSSFLLLILIGVFNLFNQISCFSKYWQIQVG